jgi:hypothetical protein
VTADKHDKAKLTLVYGSKGFSHILLKDEILEQIQHNPAFEVVFVVGSSDETVCVPWPL